MPMITTTVRKLSDQNPDGTTFGDTTADLVSFYGSPPIAQQANIAAGALTRGAMAGDICTYGTAQTPALVAANTSAEQAFTIQNGTGAAMLPATTDLVICVNKPTAQAGLGYAQARISASNTVQQLYFNATAAGITPTAGENYGYVLIRGLPTISSTLTPVAVAANTSAEQQFSVPGIPVGAWVSVVKPTTNAGLAIVGCRVVSAGSVGIHFMNLTGVPITPTAAESYTFFWTLGLDALNQSVAYSFNVGTVGAIGAGIVVTGGSTTLTGLLATDAVVGIMKPTSGAAATNAAGVYQGIPTANTLTLNYVGIGTGATPTASEIYTVHTLRMNPLAPILLSSVALTPVSVAANTTAEQTFTVASTVGLTASTLAAVNKPSIQAGLAVAGVRVSAANTLAITYVNNTAVAITPNAETYTVAAFQVPNPGAGNSVFQAATTKDYQMSNLVAALRSGIVTLGMLAGT